MFHTDLRNICIDKCRSEILDRHYWDRERGKLSGEHSQRWERRAWKVKRLMLS